ncbi:MAG: exo-alpha-sialidase [Clostridia bacterium]|nr:exo-alpha-sialidase [Clostridia bacterium]
MSVSDFNKLTTIDELNRDVEKWSHVQDDISTASVEISYRDTVELNADITGYERYRDAWYPRVKKVKDDLYLLLYMPGQFGGKELYYVTSRDGKHWNAPELLWENNEEFVHTFGPLKGKSDRYVAVNPDACVLDNGEIIAVYEIRPYAGYGQAAYLDLNGVYMKRGTVGADNSISWSGETKLTCGQAWEPFIWQRPDGLVEIYWSNVAAYVEKYGFDRKKRSTGTSVIYSDDNGHTWTPSIEEGKKNNYMYIRAYQEKVGDKIPYGDNADGTPMYTEAVPYFGGQMPSATALYNGKTLLAIEVHYLDGKFHTSLTTSPEGGNWRSLGMLEDYSDSEYVIKHINGAAPYIATFPSGEGYLTYNADSKLRARLVSPDGKTLNPYEFHAAPKARSCWGASQIVGSHKMLSVFPNAGDGSGRGIFIYTSYLNHRINANKYADGAYGNDALFVGSESQAQMTVQVAHDENNVYFLINRLDLDLTDGDTVTLNIGVAKNRYYAVTADFNGVRSLKLCESGEERELPLCGSASVKVFGTVNDGSDEDEGAVYEIVLPKNALELEGAGAFKLRPELENKDGDTTCTDTLNGTDLADVATWPDVRLD